MQRAFASAPFRFALALALVFATGSMALLREVRQQVGSYAVEATHSLLRDEGAVLTADFRALGRSGLIDAMIRHSKVGGEPQFRYLLVDRQGAHLFDTLPGASAQIGWRQTTDHEPEGDAQPLEQLGLRLPDGSLLVIATDAFDIETVRQHLLNYTAVAVIVVTLLALFGGFFAGRHFLARLDRVNVAVARIIEGECADHLPEIGVAPEFRQLTCNLNRMLDRNAAAMDALRQVSSSIAHDLRTPLTVLRQELEAARDKGETNSAVFDTAIAQADEILVIFQALLRIGMVEGGAGRQRFAPVDLGALIGRLHALYLPLAEDSNHRFIAQLPPGLIVSGDAELLAQLFTNIIENAIGHTPAGSSIVASLTQDDGGVVVRIADNGPGIADADLPHIFRRFYRGSKGVPVSGYGLGLSLAAAIAELHGAKLVAEPLAPGLAIIARFPSLSG